MVEVAYKPLEPVGKTPPLSAFDVKFGKKFISEAMYSDGYEVTLYTVPEGKVFVLLSCYLGYSADNMTGGGFTRLLTSNPNASNLLTLHCKNPPTGQIFSDSLSLSFGEGIVFPSKTSFFVRIANYSYSGIAGYEIDAKYINFSP